MDEVYNNKVEILKKEGMKWTTTTIQEGCSLYEKYRNANIIPDFVVMSRQDSDGIEIWYKERRTLEMIKKVTGHE